MHPDGADEDGAEEEQLFHLWRCCRAEPLPRDPTRPKPGAAGPVACQPASCQPPKKSRSSVGCRRERQQLTHQKADGRQEVPDAEHDHDDQGRDRPAEIAGDDKPVPARGDTRRFEIFISPETRLATGLHDRADGQDWAGRVGFESRAAGPHGFNSGATRRSGL